MLKIKLENKVVIITGGSKGLGKELARVFASEKCKVVICSRNKHDLEKACEEIGNDKCSYFTADVTDRKQVEEFIKNVIKSHGKIDILINNAGYAGKLEKLQDTSYDEMQKNFTTNLYSIFYFMKNVIPVMVKQESGIIINISSMAGKRAVPNLSSYSASKFAVIGLTSAAAKELKDTAVRFVTVCPGGMNTDMRSGIFGSEDAGKQQTPDFVATVIRDIASEKINVPSGGDIVVRHGKITSINPSLE